MVIPMDLKQSERKFLMVDRNPCINCKVHILEVSKDCFRCTNCPDKKDYLLKSNGLEPFHRKFNPEASGFEEYDPLDAIMKPEEKALLMAGPNAQIERKCHTCHKSFPIDKVDEFFYKSKRKDGYMINCKVCHNKRAKRNAKNRKKEGKRDFLLKPPPVENRTPITLTEQEMEKAHNMSPESNTPVSSDTQMVCTECGKIAVGMDEIKLLFSHHNRSNSGFYSKCKECVSKHKTEVMLKTNEKSGKYDSPQNLSVIRIDFTPHPELLERLIALSKRNFRYPNQEVLYILEKYIRGESDV